MADESIAIVDQRVNSAEGVIGRVLIEAVTESPITQLAQGFAGHRIDLAAFEGGNIHTAVLLVTPCC